MDISKQYCEASKSLVCLFCDLKCSSHEELILHLQIHNVAKPYLCMECGKGYAYKGSLKSHVESHTKEKLLYECNKCDYICANKRNLTNHKIAHSSDKNFSCNKCDFKTLSSVSLSQHRNKCDHINTFKCNECDSEFRFLNSLTKHAYNVHKNKEPFACSMCVKCFSSKSNLTKHMKIHTAHDISINENIETNQSDQTDNIEHHVDELQNNCVSCKTKLRLKKLWGRYVIDERYSFELNVYLCELALKQWELIWDDKGCARICLSCKLNLVSGKNVHSTSIKHGIPKVKKTGFVMVCSTCHTEVRRNNKKHTCSKAKIKRNIKNIINNSTITSKLTPKLEHQPILIVNEDDLNMHQSVSRLSSRQMHKQKKIWKAHFKDQGIKFRIAGQNKIDQRRKERLDDLYEVKQVRTNIGTEKNPIYKDVNVVYCNNICELAKRIAKNRNTVLSTCKLQGDHGQGSLKLSIQFDFSNSVNDLIILAVTEESKETILTLKLIEDLVNPQSLETNLGITVLRTGDLQYLQLSIGIKTGNAAYPCPFCNWRMTGVNRDAVDAVCSPRNIIQDVEDFCGLGSNRNLSHRVHGQQGEPAFTGHPADVIVPPSLHINLGLVNHVLEKMENKHTESVVQKELYEKAKVNKTSYQGGKFEGNEIQKIVKTFNIISWPNDHPFKEYCKLFYALETTNEFVFSIKTELTDVDISNVAISIREVLIQWECLKSSLCLSETVKLHVYAVHCLQFTMKHKCTPAAYGEQDGEMLHRRFRQTLEVYKTLGIKALLHSVKQWNSWNF